MLALPDVLFFRILSRSGSRPSHADLLSAALLINDRVLAASRIESSGISSGTLFISKEFWVALELRTPPPSFSTCRLDPAEPSKDLDVPTIVFFMRNSASKVASGSKRNAPSPATIGKPKLSCPTAIVGTGGREDFEVNASLGILSTRSTVPTVLLGTTKFIAVTVEAGGEEGFAVGAPPEVLSTLSGAPSVAAILFAVVIVGESGGEDSDAGASTEVLKRSDTSSVLLAVVVIAGAGSDDAFEVVGTPAEALSTLSNASSVLLVEVAFVVAPDHGLEPKDPLVTSISSQYVNPDPSSCVNSIRISPFIVAVNERTLCCQAVPGINSGDET